MSDPAPDSSEVVSLEPESSEREQRAPDGRAGLDKQAGLDTQAAPDRQLAPDQQAAPDEQAGTGRRAGPDLTGELLDELASNLLWRIGRVSDDGPVTVRVGLASSADLFQTLPRLRSASDVEVEAAIHESTLAVEWVGARPKVADR